MSVTRLYKYTVVVLYPKGFGERGLTYTAFVETPDARIAAQAGAKQAMDAQPNKKRGKLVDWIPVVVFSGHQEVVHYGWQA